MHMQLTDPIRWWARNTPDAIALVFDGDESLTYAELDRWSDNVAHHLTGAGIGLGDRVGIVGNNCVEWCVAAIGVLKIGAVLATYNQRLLASDLTHLLENSEPSVVIAAPSHDMILAEVAERTQQLGCQPFDLLGFDVIRAVRDNPHRPTERVTIGHEDAAIIVYTSGTTSTPKGVIFSPRSIFGFIFEWSLMEPVYRQGVRMMSVLSLAGSPGIAWSLLHMFTHGGTLFLEPSFDPATALRRIERERIQVFMGVPMLFEQIALQPGFADADLSSLVATTTGGAPVPMPTLEAWLAKGVHLRQIYGMSELNGSSIANSVTDALRRPDSVGTGSMFTQHRVVRPDGSDCEPGEEGEIIVQGPLMTPGYWRNPEATAETIRDGWLHSGDVGVIDDEGHLVMVDRKKDMIISGGYNISPAEIEATIHQLAGVDEVAVIGVADTKFGETPAAIISASGELDAETVTAHCRAHLADFKRPRHVVISADPLPRMPSGKIAKRELRDEYGTLGGQR